MNISHSRFILSKLKIFGEIVTTKMLRWKRKDFVLSGAKSVGAAQKLTIIMIIIIIIIIIRGGVLEDVLAWPRGRPREQILKSLVSKVKSLALASRPQVLENWPVLGSRTA